MAPISCGKGLDLFMGFSGCCFLQIRFHGIHLPFGINLLFKFDLEMTPFAVRSCNFGIIVHCA